MGAHNNCSALKARKVEPTLSNWARTVNIKRLAVSKELQMTFCNSYRDVDVAELQVHFACTDFCEITNISSNVVGRDILTLSPFIPGRPGGPGSPGKPKSPLGPWKDKQCKMTCSQSLGFTVK